MYEMGLAASPKTNLRDVCHSYLQQIAQRTGDMVFLTMRSGFDGVCIDRAEGAFPIKVFVLDVGMRRPLSFLNDDEINRILSVNMERSLEKYPNYSEANVRKTIARARTKGFVLTDVIDLPGVRSIAMPIFDSHRQPIAAISLSTVVQRMDRSRTETLLNDLSSAVEQIQSKLILLEDDA